MSKIDLYLAHEKGLRKIECTIYSNLADWTPQF